MCLLLLLRTYWYSSLRGRRDQGTLSLSLPGWRRGASVCGQGRLLLLLLPLLRSLLVFVRREGGFAHSRKGEREKGGETERREGGRHSPIHRNRRRRRKPAPPPPPLRSNRGRRGCGIESGKKRENGEKRERRKEKKRRFGLGEGGGQKRLCSPLLIASTVEAGVVEELFRFPPPLLPPPRKKREPD